MHLLDWLVELGVTLVATIEADVQLFGVVLGPDANLVDSFLGVVLVSGHWVATQFALLNVGLDLCAVRLNFLDFERFGTDTELAKVTVVADWLVVDWKRYLERDIFRDLLRLKLLVRPLLHCLLRWLQPLILKHLFIHEIELGIMGSVDDLLGSFSSPYLRKQVLNDILLGLLDDSLALSELLLQLVLLGTRDHTFLFGFLSEGSVGILVLPVWILPKLSDE